MTFRVVPIAEEHIEGFHAALDSVCRERRYLLFLEAPPLEETRKFVRGNLAKGYPAHVALADGKVVGWCDILPIDRPTRAHNGVLGMAVVAGFRGQGIGAAMMRATIERARMIGLTRIELSVREDNHSAAALYKKFGFEVEGKQRKAILLDGEYQNLISMALLFD
jgi:ribosomal protein S18 acetylase RimI-like enzyme